MGYKKDESDAWAEEKEPCGQHYFSCWGLMTLHKIWDMERDKSGRANVTPPRFVYLFMRKITGMHTRQPRFHLVSHDRPPSLG